MEVRKSCNSTTKKITENMTQQSKSNYY